MLTNIPAYFAILRNLMVDFLMLEIMVFRMPVENIWHSLTQMIMSHLLCLKNFMLKPN